MKRLNSHTVAARLDKRLVLNRETLRRLGAEELEHAVGASIIATCGCPTTKQLNNNEI